MEHLLPILHRLGKWTGVKVPRIILDALYLLQGYFKNEVSEQQLADFSESYWTYVSENLSDDKDELDNFDEDDDELDEFDFDEGDG